MFTGAGLYYDSLLGKIKHHDVENYVSGLEQCFRIELETIKLNDAVKINILISLKIRSVNITIKTKVSLHNSLYITMYGNRRKIL